MRRPTPTAASTAPPGPVGDLPGGFDLRQLARRAAQVAVLLAVLVLIAVLAPGLGEVRERLSGARPGWIALAVVFEVLSSLSYVLMFRPVFCSLMSWRAAAEVGLSEVGTGSIIPASGAGGVALGAWVLSRAGMSGETIARRSVAFLLLKSSVNFAAVTVVGLLVFAGVIGPPQSPWLTVLPAGLSAAVIAALVLVGHLPAGEPAGDDASRLRRLWSRGRSVLVRGTAEAGVLLRRRDPVLLLGIVGYWVWDNLALWATFHAVGYAPGASVILLGYLIGQLGGLLPIPGGIGGIDGGLIGTLIVYGAPASAAAAAVLAYRIILFWIPLMLGAVAFVALRRSMARPGGFIPCAE
ncbi:MAG TPA: flippase-like domain-containing protein [Baekduia sp.]|uniref:flippase-like domain-containing protein n=1 Tax=Baekduia sp. TaxID=2600305 RepID=UPI002CB5A1B1|nr:flippase-like domain-containing protein [Baekduia sp.]HMJ32558.1 flippase-like domain-containing protein [Baekduia sp.]